MEGRHAALLPTAPTARRPLREDKLAVDEEVAAGARSGEEGREGTLRQRRRGMDSDAVRGSRRSGEEAAEEGMKTKKRGEGK